MRLPRLLLTNLKIWKLQILECVMQSAGMILRHILAEARFTDIKSRGKVYCRCCCRLSVNSNALSLIKVNCEQKERPRGCIE